ncbi:cytochrome P450 [Aspergillus aurantiobrunneus]
MPLPILGNQHQIPHERAWLKYKEWSDQYGPLMTVRHGNTISIVVTSWKILKGHLERRNAIYSHRPTMGFFFRATRGLNAAVMPYGSSWTMHCNLRSYVLKLSITRQYRPIQDAGTRKLPHGLLALDIGLSCSLRRCISSTFTTVGYGQHLETDSAEIREVEELNHRIAVDSKHNYTGHTILHWLLSSRAQPRLQKWEEEADKVGEKLTLVLERLFTQAGQTTIWNMAKQFTARSLYEASLAAYHGLRVIVLAALLHPDEVEHVQEELDQVVGCDRLPHFDNTLPRWALCHDKSLFPDPSIFLPGQYLQDPSLPKLLFSYCQRGCPGCHLGADSLLSPLPASCRRLASAQGWKMDGLSILTARL